MKFNFEKIFQKTSNLENSQLHEDFQIKEDAWLFNRRHNIATDESICLKTRFAFDKLSLLDDCPYMAKIGINLDDNLPYRYIGFAYGDKENRNTLFQWAQKFPYSELIENLDYDGVSTEASSVTIINQQDGANRIEL